MSERVFVDVIESDLAPMIDGAGFARQGLCWKRVREPFIDCIEIQTRSDGVACCVNLGEHLSFLPAAGGTGIVYSANLTSADCEIKRRLAPEGVPERWWNFEDAQNEAMDMIACFEGRAEAFFSAYRDFPEPFVSITPDGIDSDAVLELLPTMTKVRRILLIARVYDHVGNAQRALDWAELGKQIAGMAVGPKEAFRQLIRKYSAHDPEAQRP